jgi:hypothetical protein
LARSSLSIFRTSEYGHKKKIRRPKTISAHKDKTDIAGARESSGKKDENAALRLLLRRRTRRWIRRHETAAGW